MAFTRHPQPLAAPLGDAVDFECSLNLGAEKFAWRHRPLGSERWGPLINSPNSGGKTSKHVVNFDDPFKAGDYRCIAFYGEKRIFFFFFSLSVVSHSSSAAVTVPKDILGAQFYSSCHGGIASLATVEDSYELNVTSRCLNAGTAIINES